MYVHSKELERYPTLPEISSRLSTYKKLSATLIIELIGEESQCC